MDTEGTDPFQAPDSVTSSASVLFSNGEHFWDAAKTYLHTPDSVPRCLPRRRRPATAARERNTPNGSATVKDTNAAAAPCQRPQCASHVRGAGDIAIHCHRRLVHVGPHTHVPHHLFGHVIDRPGGARTRLVRSTGDAFRPPTTPWMHSCARPTREFRGANVVLTGVITGAEHKVGMYRCRLYRH